ncbi:hypothetical protein OG21DRAFT_1492429, partial [Imleria badia]
MASRSAEQPHVRFAPQLPVPQADRQRKSHSFYPKVAQEKGRSQRQSSFDLFWRWDGLSSIPYSQEKRKHHQPKRLAAEVNKRDCTTLLGYSRGIAQHTRQRRKRPWLPLHDVLGCSQTLLQTVPLELVHPP